MLEAPLTPTLAAVVVYDFLARFLAQFKGNVSVIFFLMELFLDSLRLSAVGRYQPLTV